MKRLLDHDPFLGLTEVFHMDESEDKFWVETIQDETPLVEENKAVFNEFNRADDRWGEEIGGRTRVASIPPIVQHKLMVEGIWADKDRLKKWLNSADAMPYRTRPGRI